MGSPVSVVVELYLFGHATLTTLSPAVHNDEIDNFYEHLNRRNADILHLHLTCTAYPSHLRIIGWVGLQKD